MKKKISILKKSLSLGLAFLMALSAGISGVKVQGEETGIKDKTVTVALESVEHLTVKLNDLEDREINIFPGSEVKIDVEAEDGYQIDEVKAEDSEGYKAEVTQKDSSYYVRADRDLTIKFTVSNLQVEKPGKEETDGEDYGVEEEIDNLEGEEKGERVAPYDAEEFGKLIASICDFGNVSDIMLMANVGEGITTLPSQHTEGRAIDFVRYYSDGSYAVERSYNEGRFTTTDGEEVYCAYPDFYYTTYVVGEYASYDATRRFDNETIKTIGMMLYYFDNYVDCSSFTAGQRYLIRQCVIWSVVNEFWGLNPGCTIEFGNGMKDAAGHDIAGHTATALYYGAQFAADAAIREEFNCWGLVFENENTLAGNGSTQLLSQFFYERQEKGDFELQKSSSNSWVSNGNPCYSLEGAEYTLYDENKTAVTRVTTDANGYAKSEKVKKGKYTLKETKAPKGYAIDEKTYSIEIISKNTTKIRVSDTPLCDLMGLELTKIDQDSKGTANVKSLEGAQFEVKYYAIDPDDYKDASDLTGLNASRTWVIETKAEEVKGKKVYRAGLGDLWKISGDDFYYQDGVVCLPIGILTLEEITAPEGYKLQGATYKTDEMIEMVEGLYFGKIQKKGDAAYLTYGNTYTVSDKSIRGGVKVAKWDNESNAQSPQGNAALESATIEIINKNDYDVVVNGQAYGKGQTVLSLKTDANGNAQTASDALPYGLYEVKETNAPVGYLNDGSSISQEVFIEVDGVIIDLNNDTNAIKNNIIRGGAQLGKWDNESKTQKAQGAASLEGAEFEITNESAHDVIVNGKTYKKGEVVAKLVSNEKGIAKSAADLLPYGKYSYEETKAPTGYLATGSGLTGTFEIKEDGVIVDLNKKDTAIKNNVIRGDITFTKSDAETSERMANIPFKISSKTTGESHIIYTDENGYYSSESQYVKHSENTNAEKAKCGTWFGLDADGKQVDVRDSVGAFPYDTYTIEELSCDANEGKALFKGTFTISMNGFTIDYGTITNADLAMQTTAKDAASNMHTAYAREEVTIVDNVFYTGLKKNQTYTIKGILMDKESEEPLLDVDGNQITAETNFTTVTKNGLVDVTFVFDGRGMEGKDLVVFEECYDKEGNLIVEHKDITDEGQTIHFEKKPEIKTTAIDSDTEDHLSSVKDKVTIVDTVTYKNLIVGKKYTISGTLMDKATGKALKDSDGEKITAETSFKAKETDGSVEVIFTFDASDYAGKTTVVFEDLYYNKTLVATHADITDEGQTVYFPEIKTTAKDAASDSHNALPSKETTIIDTVKYTNLLVGKTYTAKGTLMDKDTKEPLLDAEGKQITGETSFTPEKANGTVEVSFSFDASNLGGRSLVVFEKIYDANGKEIANHEDINDQDQTVTVSEKENSVSNSSDETKKTEKRVSTVKTGDEGNAILYIILLSVALIIGFAVIIRRKMDIK